MFGLNLGGHKVQTKFRGTQYLQLKPSPKQAGQHIQTINTANI